MKILNLNVYILIMGIFFIARSCYATALQKDLKINDYKYINDVPNQVKNEDISEILNQKLYKYDINRRNFSHATNRNFSLNYNKSYGRNIKSDIINSPMLEQRKKLDNFKNFDNGPCSEEKFYGFSLQIPLETK